MKRLRRKPVNVLVDMSALLDIIFILLLVVFSNYLLTKNTAETDLDRQKEQAVEREAQAQEAQKEADNVKKTYQQMMETFGYTGNVVVRAFYDEADPTKREVYLLFDDADDPEKFVLEGNAVSDTYDVIKTKISRYVRDHSENPVILSLNSGEKDILYRDEVKILSMFEELRVNFSNVYVR